MVRFTPEPHEFRGFALNSVEGSGGEFAQVAGELG